MKLCEEQLAGRIEGGLSRSNCLGTRGEQGSARYLITLGRGPGRAGDRARDWDVCLCSVAGPWMVSRRLGQECWNSDDVDDEGWVSHLDICLLLGGW